MYERQSTNGVNLTSDKKSWRSISFFNDFVGAYTNLSYSVSGSGAGATGHIPPEPANDVYGIAFVRKGTTATGRACIFAGDGVTMIAGYGKLEFEGKFQVKNALANATDAYVLRIGFGNSFSADHTHGAYFEYNYAVSPNWYYCRAANGVRTKTDTGKVVDNNWHTFKITISADGKTIKYFIDGALVGSFTNVTDLNSNITYSFGAMFSIVSSAGILDRYLYVDWLKFNWDIASKGRPTI